MLKKMTSAFLGVISMSAFAKPIQVQGHRGTRALRPENTWPAFEYGMEAGADVLELDLGVSKDNRLIISHDPFINPEHCLDAHGKKMDAPIPIHTLTLKQIKKYDCGSIANPKFPKQQTVAHTHLLTLDELFKDIQDESWRSEKAKRIGFNIETKSFPNQPEMTPSPAAFTKLVVDCIKKYGMLERSTLQSFDYRTLLEARKLEPKLRLSALVEKPDLDLVKLAKELGVEIISPNYKLVTPKLVTQLHEMHVEVLPWTANEPEVWDALIAAKVDGIISDDPEALIAYLKIKGLR